MKRFVLGLMLTGWIPLAFSEGVAIPIENQKKGVMPSLANWEEDLRKLVATIEKNDTAAARAYFFPREAFLQLKAMKGAERYYDEELIKHFDHDVGTAHERLKVQTDWELASFEKGRCVWKEKGTEYNAIPYWSCYRNKIHLKKGDAKLTIPLRTLINWGPRWYVTHLK